MRAWGCALVLLLVSVLELGAGCGGKVPPPPPRQTRLELLIHAFQLASNGLRVVVAPDPKASRVQVTMRYRVGQIDEPPGREGIAHLAEHLMFLPIVGPERQTLFGKLEATAPWFNGFTELETTTYVSRADPSRLAELLQLEGLRLGIRCKTLTEEEFVRERDVVRNELRQRDRGLRLSGALLAALYPVPHPYRQAETAEGKEEVVGRISREEACAFIEAHYSPDNAVLIVSGNVIPAAVDRELGKLLGRIAKQPVAAPPRVAPLAPNRPVMRVVPIDEPAAVVAWPLPHDPAARARMRAVATMMALHINPQIKGGLGVTELGAAGAPAIAFVIAPGRDEPLGDAIDAAGRAALAMQVWFRPESFESARARAAHDLFARFEDGTERDRILADHVFAGREPAAALRAEVSALARLSASEARQIVQDRFSFSSAAIVRLSPELARKPTAAAPAAAASPVELAPRLHRPGESRVRADPAAAHAEARRASVRDPLLGHRDLTLANGLRVILMPLTSLPTVDVRLVFSAGWVDEPERARGVSYLAARGLRPRGEDASVANAFYTTGGAYNATVGREHTTFAARGLGMHIDVLLSGLERIVRNGAYPERVREEIVRRAEEQDGGEDPLVAIWRAALYGSEHPYARAADWRGARLDELKLGVLRRYHAAHFRPGAATLIVAGGFDPEVAARWIDHLFADWKGAPAAARGAERVKTRPIAIAKHSAGARQVAVNVALPLDGGGRAAGLVAAGIVDAAIAEVRTRLGASYVLGAQLLESRLSSHLVISGFVAAERVEEAFALVRERLGSLAAGDDAAASRFVAARRAVMARLSSIDAGASSLADLAETAVELDRPLDADLRAAEDARKLTLDRMAGTLGAIDLARGAILLDGPPDAVLRAFTALGRTPDVVAR